MKVKSAAMGVVVAACLSCAMAPSPARRQERPAIPLQLAGASPAGAEASQESMWKAQKLVRNGDIDLEVGDVSAAAHEISDIAAKHDGIIAGSQTSQYSGRRQASITVRVPAAEFDATLAELRKLGTVSREGVNTEDVTKAYFDLETRLTVKRETANRLREILARRTGNLADVIAAEAELSRVTEEIEVMEGEKRFFDHRVATSTIEVSLTEAAVMNLSFVAPVYEALRDSGRVFVASLQAMIYLVTALLPWGLVAAIIWWIVRRVNRRRRTA